MSALAPSPALAPELRSNVPAPQRTVSGHTPAKAPLWLAAIVLLVLLGFATRGAVLTRQLADPAHAVHGATALGWSLMLVVQAWLAQNRMRHWHRLLAIPAMICAIVMVASAPPMLRTMAAAAVAHPAAAPVINQLLLLDALSLSMFVLLVAVAVANVRQPQVHARAMAASAFIALPPGLGRLFMYLLPVPPFVGAYLAIGAGSLLLIALIVHDRRAGVKDRVLPVMLVAFVLHGVIAATTWDTPLVFSMVRALGS